MRVPREFREQHAHIPRARHLRGHTHAYGVTVPAFNYPWACTCGEQGRSGGRGGHQEHVRVEYADAIERGRA